MSRTKTIASQNTNGIKNNLGILSWYLKMWLLTACGRHVRGICKMVGYYVLTRPHATVGTCSNEKTQKEKRETICYYWKSSRKDSVVTFVRNLCNQPFTFQANALWRTAETNKIILTNLSWSLTAWKKIPRGSTTPLEDILKKVIYSDKATRRMFIFIFSIPWGLEHLKAVGWA